MIGGHIFGIDCAMANNSLLLALRSEREKAMWAIQGEEDTRGAPHRLPVPREVGIGEQPELKLVWVVPDESDLPPGH